MLMLEIGASVDAEEWEAVAQQCAFATFFHTPAWSSILCETYAGYEVATWGTTLNSGTRLICPVVVTGKRVPAGAISCESTPLYAYGGPIANGPVDATELEQALRKFIRSKRSQLYFWQMTGNPHFPLALGKPFARHQGSTHLIDLRQGLQAIRSGYSKTQKQGVRTAERAGINVRAGDSLRDWETYYSLYQESIVRWGEVATSKHPWKLFDAARKRQGGSVVLWLAELAGEACAGAVVLYKHPIACYWHGASSQRYAKQMASKLLQDRIIQDACARGLTTYDLLGSGNHEGVAKFKASLGSTCVAFPSYEWNCSAMRRLSFFVKRQLHRLPNGPLGRHSPPLG